MIFNKLQGVELFAPGKWNGYKFGLGDLENIAAAFKQLESLYKIPLKLGHNDEQPLTDGQPALGWVENVRVEAERLVADFVDMPEIVHAAISKKLYNTLSIELEVDVQYKDNRFPFLLSGVALLGADLPSVNVLSDLQNYIDGKDKTSDIKASKKFAFSYKPTIKPEGEKMPISQEEYDALQKQISDLTTSNAELKTANMQFEADRKAAADAAEKAKFTKAKADVTNTMEALVKCGKITPAQRDTFAAKIVDGDFNSVSTISDLVLSFGKPEPEKTPMEQSSNRQGEDHGSQSADKVLLSKVKKMRAENTSLSFTAAKVLVMEANPELAQEYKELTREV